jgi:hypothetical protein
MVFTAATVDPVSPVGDNGRMADRSSLSSGIPRWARILMWSLSLGFAVLGIVLAIVLQSWLPLLTFVLGFALPFVPIGTPLARRSRLTAGTR